MTGLSLTAVMNGTGLLPDYDISPSTLKLSDWDKTSIIYLLPWYRFNCLLILQDTGNSSKGIGIMITAWWIWYMFLYDMHIILILVFIMQIVHVSYLDVYIQKIQSNFDQSQVVSVQNVKKLEAKVILEKSKNITEWVEPFIYMVEGIHIPLNCISVQMLFLC